MVLGVVVVQAVESTTWQLSVPKNRFRRHREPQQPTEEFLNMPGNMSNVKKRARNSSNPLEQTFDEMIDKLEDKVPRALSLVSSVWPSRGQGPTIGVGTSEIRCFGVNLGKVAIRCLGKLFDVFLDYAASTQGTLPTCSGT